MFLIAGLGNPERRYAGNRHNAGFMVVDELARRAGTSLTSTKFDGHLAKVSLRGAEVVLLKPMTFMNRSGSSVGPAARFYKLEPAERLVVLHDELDLEFGAVRIKRGGGTAGHNGLRSIAASLGTTDFLRVRLGIDRPEHGSVSSYVLSDFSPDEAKDLDTFIEAAADAVETLLLEGPVAAMNKHHVRTGKSAQAL